MHTKQKIHVVHLIGSTGLYGAERWILALMRGLDPAIVTSTLINLVDEEHEHTEVVAAAKQRGLNARDFYTGGRFNPLSALRMARWLRQNNVKILHGHGFKSDMFALLAGRMAGCKVISTPHGWSVDKDIKLQLYEKLDRFLFRFMDRVCPLSTLLHSGLEGSVNPSKLRLIFNGVDVDEVRATLPADEAIGDGFVVGYIGRLVALKDIPTLLTAIKKVARDSLNIKLVIIGDGPDRELLEQQATSCGFDEHVQFLGYKADAVAYLSLFDVFVLPSLSEGIPRCIMEAMAVSVPVVVSDIPGCKAVVTNGETGLIFAAGNSADLADKIKFVITNPDKAKVMAVAGAEKIDNEFSNHRMAQEYADLYAEILSAG